MIVRLVVLWLVKFFFFFCDWKIIDVGMLDCYVVFGIIFLVFVVIGLELVVICVMLFICKMYCDLVVGECL